MVNIDTVYQRVLALANKEQRGYITPQEFNLFANQAQLEILDQYFYDRNQFNRLKGNDTSHSDMIDLLEEKIGFLETTTNSTCVNCLGHNLPLGLYHLNTVFDRTYNYTLEKTTHKEYLNRTSTGSTLLTPNNRLHTGVYYHLSSSKIITQPSASVGFRYIKVPRKASWGYVVINKKAMYDAAGPSNGGSTVHFELHPMEETELVYKILKLAGLSMKRDDVAKGGQGLESLKIQQEKQ
jgi:hypothetical protein